jgi:hypothetical protein
MSTIRIKGPDFKSIIKQDGFYVFLVALLVFIVCTRLITQRESVYLTHDEFSQYSIAAFFAGFDWSSVTSLIPYYQFGYPLVFILPLFWIFGDDIQMVYHASLVVNALLAALMVPLVYYLLKHWGLKSFWENKVSILIAAMLTLQGCVVAYSNLGISEILLMVLGLLSTALIVKILKTGASHKTVMFLAFVLVYGYASHMRFLGVLLSGVIVFVLMVLCKKTEKKYLISFFAVLLISIVISESVKHYIQANIWLFSDTGLLGSSDGNDIIATSGRLRTFFTRPGFGGFVRVSFGQMWYMGFASFLLVFVGLLVILRDNILWIKKFIKEKLYSDYDFTALFIFCGFISTLIIGALFFMYAGMGTATRADWIMYGRYNSIMLIPISLYALSAISYSKQKPYIIGIISIIIFIISAVFLNSFNERFLSGIWVMYFNVINYIVFESVYLNTFFAINVFLIILMSMLTKYKQLLLSFALAIMMIFNIHAGYLFLSGNVFPYDKTIGFNSLTELREYEKIYYFSNESFKISKIQMALPNTKINIVQDFTGITSDDILLACSQRLMAEIVNHRVNVNASAVANGVVQVHDYTFGRNPVRLPISLFSSQNGDVHGNSITSTGELGFLVFGPFSRLEPGSYSFSAQLELLNQSEAPYDIGFVDLTFHTEAAVLNHRYLFLGDFADGVLTVNLDLETAEPLPNFEFRVLVTEGTLLKVSDIAILFTDSD